jgi:cytochrome c-type biogenesis protein CcmH
MKRLLAAMVTALVLSGAPAAQAVQPDEIMTDPAKEARARELSKELRCMVCQNQSIDDSDASLAKDLRVLVRERIAAGDSNSQVLDYLVARYGEFVLLRPRFEWNTLLLWLLPPLALLGGAFGLWRYSRKRTAATSEVTAAPPLSADEQARLDQLLADKASDRTG